MPFLVGTGTPLFPLGDAPGVDGLTLRTQRTHPDGTIEAHDVPATLA